MNVAANAAQRPARSAKPISVQAADGAKRRAFGRGLRREDAIRRLFLGYAAGAVEVGGPVAAECSDLDDAAGVGGVDELAVADVDTDVA
jgi:hypothetical protein